MASVFRSLQCLISTLTHAVEVVSCLGLLVQSRCGEGGCCRQMSLACVGSTSGFPATLGLPHSQVCVLSLSTLLRLQVALQGWALSCMHFPGLSCSGSGFWVIHKAQTWLGLCLVPSLVRAAQATRSLTSALSPDAVHLIPSAVLASVSGHASQVILVSLLGS